MSDMGDDFRAMRDFNRSVRRHWHSCPNCAAAYGTGTKVPPGETCRNCEWQAPGKVGDDMKSVREEQWRRR